MLIVDRLSGVSSTTCCRRMSEVGKDGEQV